MEKSKITSFEILKLEKQLDQGNREALEQFWSNIEEKGSPLIEDIKEDPDYHLVTFIYKGDDKVKNVLVIPEMEDCMFLNYKMERLLDTNLWYISCIIRNDIRLQYNYSVNDPLDDDWDSRFENLQHDELNKNFLYVVDEDDGDDEILSYVVMPKADEHIWVKENNHISKGKIMEYSLESSRLEASRRVRVYTPHGYNEDGQPYKFLVLTDGDEYLELLSVKNVLDNLIADKKIPPVITLFIDSTDTREEELSCSDLFLDIVINDFMPWFRKNYNISQEARDGIIGGLSLGGLTASYIGLNYSEVFGNVLSQSGAYWYKPNDWDKEESDCWISSQFKKIEKLPLKFYLNVGVLEEKENMIGVNKKLRDVLQAKGYKVEYEEFKGGHDYLCWGENLSNGLISLIGHK
ncbi:alpha/beta hydrolase-fold protein [Dethiothermospora halolimnae]|uniref:alpha/beta hydrolase-fold protein n=1 Tax=Dethiothermospora halolimnae TaxID=3114390 RepID=UPI003CCC1BCC